MKAKEKKQLGTYNQGVAVTEKSGNAKTGAVAATYAAPVTCPNDCPLKDGGGCYGECGVMNLHRLRLSRTLLTAEQVILNEAKLIKNMSGKRPLRIHVVGDAKTDTMARTLAEAAEIYRGRHGQGIWTYTHAWRTVLRASFGLISVLASCELARDAWLAMARGYAAALLVEEHSSKKVYTYEGLQVLPCPAQTSENVTCSSCGLCLRDNYLKQKELTIAFAMHGSVKRVKNTLTLLKKYGIIKT